MSRPLTIDKVLEVLFKHYSFRYIYTVSFYSNYIDAIWQSSTSANLLSSIIFDSLFCNYSTHNIKYGSYTDFACFVGHSEPAIDYKYLNRTAVRHHSISFSLRNTHHLESLGVLARNAW